jgi:hypothetical protein
LVATVVSTSGGRGKPSAATIRDETAAVVYGAVAPRSGRAEYHNDTVSSRRTSGRHGSARAVSVRCSQVVPTAYGAVGGGRLRAGAAVAAELIISVTTSGNRTAKARIFTMRLTLGTGGGPGNCRK